jgi:hypothetical protein|tara:strand:- start:6179 stop:7279 length:1101 start_codon:yes stop_codon:yes gene_type:complete
MKLKLKNTPEQVELVKAMGSKDLTVAREAQEAFAAFLGPVVQQVLNQAGTANAIFADAAFDEDDSPSYPLDLYYNNGDNHVSVWMQSVAGGLPSSHVEGMNELKISTYRLDSAINMLKRYVRRARLDVVSKGVERMAQEILVKQERNAWAVILKALGEASTGGNAHTIQTSGRTNFMLSDLNDLMTRVRRINESFANGTPDVAYSNGLTDLYMSPERMADVRAMAYNPVNTKGANNITGTAASGTIAMPDGVRESIYNSAGATELFGVTLNEMNEFGIGKKYCTLFGEFDSISFAPATDDLVVGLDNSKGAFIRPVATQADSGGAVVTLADDQWSVRSEKLGFYSFVEEGRVCIDSRAVVGLSLEA